MDNALLQTLIWFIVGGVITVFTRRQGSQSVFEQRLNGNGAKRSTGEMAILRHAETTQDVRLESMERWRNLTDERFVSMERKLDRLERIELRLTGIEHAISLLSLKTPEVGT